MRGSPLVIDVDDLIGHPESNRSFSGDHRVSIGFDDVTVNGPAVVSGTVTGTIEGVLARFTVVAPAHFSCVRCLTQWDDQVEVEGTQHFSRQLDEDGYGIVGKTIDLRGPATDELALGMPKKPMCRKDCKGLCPICGTDLNTQPCDGHGDDPESPFAALKDLLDP